MDGSAPKKSTPYKIKVIQNITNENELKAKLKEIAKTGTKFRFDVSSCLKSLLKSSDREIVHLSIEAVAELAKSDKSRKIYANKEIIEPILSNLPTEATSENAELIKLCCRALANLCCECDASRKVILDNKGVPVLIKLLTQSMSLKADCAIDIKRVTGKTLMNFTLGGGEFTECVVKEGITEVAYKMLTIELEKDDMDDDMVSTAVLILSMMHENDADLIFEPKINTAVLDVLRGTSNFEISDFCLDHLHTQAEHDSVKTLLADAQGVQLVCKRLQELIQQREAGTLTADESDVESVIKQACDLVIMILTGDEAMHTLYNKGTGEVYTTMVEWLDSSNHHLLTTGVLAMGNFARQDDYCAKMMEEKIYDKLLDIFETYKHVSNNENSEAQPYDAAIVTKIQHAVLSALRNLTVPVAIKKIVAAQGRAAPMLLEALPAVDDHHVAYKMLAAVRMLVDKQVDVAKLLVDDRVALAAVGRWGHAAQYSGAASEAPRLLAWAARQLAPVTAHWRNIVEVEGCLSSLINMVVACHPVMQNEAILALTLLAIESFKPQPDTEFDYEKCFITQLLKCEIGKHVTVLIDTNCAKMPLEVAKNLLAFLTITSEKNKLALDYKEAKVDEALQKLMETRKEMSEDLKTSIANVLTIISDNGKTD